jgi:hypothetical protein
MQTNTPNVLLTQLIAENSLVSIRQTRGIPKKNKGESAVGRT